MSARDRKMHAYRLRLEAEAAAAVETGEQGRDDARAPASRMEQRGQWVDIQIEQAMRRGEFDDLPGAGRPIPGIDAPHDPDWWLKSLIERERITGVLPPALALRTKDAQLDGELDREATAESVRQVVEDFNARIVKARRQLQGGPPVITPLRDVDREIRAWDERRRTRIARQKALLEQARQDEASSAPVPWWRRLIDQRRRLI